MTMRADVSETTIKQAARMSGELGIRTLDLQADIAALAERVDRKSVV